MSRLATGSQIWSCVLQNLLRNLITESCLKLLVRNQLNEQYLPRGLKSRATEEPLLFFMILYS